MWNYLKLPFIALIFLSFNNGSLITNADQIYKPIIISTLEGDLTGNSQHETIQLKGNLLKQNGDYYQNIWVEIKSLHSEKWKIPFTSGYEPKIQLLDLNHDHVSDLFYQSIASKSDELYAHHLYSLKNGVIEEISLPEQSYIKGDFDNYFQVKVQVSIKNHKPIIINVEDRAKEYIELGLYDTQGILLKPSSIRIAPISLYEPILISKSKGYGLKSYQKVSGAHDKDILGTIEILWYYENGNWIILHTDWVPPK